MGHVGWPAATNGATTLTGPVLDLVSSAPVSWVDASVCRFIDPTCSSPLVQGQSDAQGNLTLPVPATNIGLGADGYLQITAPGLVPALYFWGYPVGEPRAPVAAPDILVATPAEAQGFLSLGGPGWDQTRGWIEFDVFDCGLNSAPGVRVAIDSTDPSVREYYGGGGLSPSFNATATDSSGLGGFVNVPPGTVTLTATPSSLGKVSSHAHVLVRAGTLTVVFLYPTP